VNLFAFLEAEHDALLVGDALYFLVGHVITVLAVLLLLHAFGPRERIVNLLIVLELRRCGRIGEQGDLGGLRVAIELRDL
jgi:hypothetical protein